MESPCVELQSAAPSFRSHRSCVSLDSTTHLLPSSESIQSLRRVNSTTERSRPWTPVASPAPQTPERPPTPSSPPPPSPEPFPSLDADPNPFSSLQPPRPLDRSKLPPWDRTVDIVYHKHKHGETTYDHVAAFETALHAFATHHHHEIHQSSILQLPPRARLLIFQHLIATHGRVTKPITLNLFGFNSECWQTSDFVPLGDALDPLRPYLAVSFGFRADIMVAFLLEHVFHATFTPFVGERLSPLATTWLNKYGPYMRSIVVEVDLSRLFLSPHRTAVNLSPRLGRLDNLLWGFSVSQMRREAPLESLILLCRRFYGRREGIEIDSKRENPHGDRFAMEFGAATADSEDLDIGSGLTSSEPESLRSPALFKRSSLSSCEDRDTYEEAWETTEGSLEDQFESEKCDQSVALTLEDSLDDEEAGDVEDGKGELGERPDNDEVEAGEGKEAMHSGSVDEDDTKITDEDEDGEAEDQEDKDCTDDIGNEKEGDIDCDDFDIMNKLTDGHTHRIEVRSTTQSGISETPNISDGDIILDAAINASIRLEDAADVQVTVHQDDTRNGEEEKTSDSTHESHQEINYFKDESIRPISIDSDSSLPTLNEASILSAAEGPESPNTSQGSTSDPSLPPQPEVTDDTDLSTQRAGYIAGDVHDIEVSYQEETDWVSVDQNKYHACSSSSSSSSSSSGSDPIDPLVLSLLEDLRLGPAYCDQDQMICNHLLRLRDRVTSLRMAGFTESYTHSFIATLFPTASTASGERASGEHVRLFAREHAYRVSPSTLWPRMSGQSSVIDCDGTIFLDEHDSVGVIDAGTFPEGAIQFPPPIVEDGVARIPDLGPTSERIVRISQQRRRVSVSERSEDGSRASLDSVRSEPTMMLRRDYEGNMSMVGYALKRSSSV